MEECLDLDLVGSLYHILEGSRFVASSVELEYGGGGTVILVAVDTLDALAWKSIARITTLVGMGGRGVVTGTHSAPGLPQVAKVVVVAPSQADGALRGGRGMFPCLASTEASPEGDRGAEEVAGGGSSSSVNHVDN